MTSQNPRPQEFEGRIAPNKDWREIVAWVGDLPPMPQVAAQAIALVEQPETTAQELNDLLLKDAALAARVLKIANSAMFSRQREITTVTQAVMVIGFKALKGIIVAATLRQMNRGTSKYEKIVWEHSLGVAVAATLLCRHFKKSYHEEIFLLGLLHSLGQVVLLSQESISAEYQVLLKGLSTTGLTYAEAEQAHFGFAHPLIGALVAKKWNFSAETCQVILHCQDDDLDGSAANSLEEKTLVVAVADMIAHMAQIGSPENYPINESRLTGFLEKLGVPASDMTEFLASIASATAEQFSQEQGIYS